jgi:hypothetical protein
MLAMRHGSRADVAARLFLTIGALFPYWRFLTFGVVYITDDYFASDIYNGELPGRALIGQLIRQGEAPIWTSSLCSGLPLAGSAADPIGLAAFTLFRPAIALDLFVIVLVLVAAHGAYGLARRFGADRTGAVLAGLAFAGSGYLAAQLKHLSIVSTVVWLPVGLTLIDRALAPAGAKPPATGGRAFFMAVFGLVFAQQVLSGFPQSAYICALVYGSFALFRTIGGRTAGEALTARIGRLAGIGVATVLGAAAGAVVLLPLSALGTVSDRAEVLGYDWSTRLAYWPSNVLTFLVPYINGDISNNTYIGPPFFWEDYGYIGVLAFLMALYGGIRERRRPVVMFSIVMTGVAYLCVLGGATPFFRMVYELVPGMKMFRFPTRFLIVVELGLAVLAAVGLTRLRADLTQRWPRPSRTPLLIAIAICTATALDLFVHQPRQNPVVPAAEWMAAPPTIDVVHGDTSQPRTFTPRQRELHRRAFQLAHGWSNVDPYFEIRDVLQPNTGGGFWNTPSADCYAGIAARWYVDVWGDHNREGSLVSLLAALDFENRVLRVHPALPKIMKAYGVSHILSPYPQQQGAALPLVRQAGNAYVYRIDGAARVRVVGAARHTTSAQDTARRLLDAAFDPDREILLYDAPASVRPVVDDSADAAASAAPGTAAIVRENTREIVIDATATQDGFLLLADTFYPGWTAHVDGVATPIYRANHSVRAIQLPRGRHEIRFTYDAPGFARGLRITAMAMALLLIWTSAAGFVRWRSGRARERERDDQVGG